MDKILLQSFIFMINVLMYKNIITLCMKALDCVPRPSGWVSTLDELPCPLFNGEPFAIAAVVVAVLYGIVPPLCIVCCLCKHGRRSHHELHAHIRNNECFRLCFGWASAPYLAHYYYWEVVQTFIKGSMAMAGVLLYPENKVLVMCSILGVSLVVHLWHHPYRDGPGNTVVILFCVTNIIAVCVSFLSAGTRRPMGHLDDQHQHSNNTNYTVDASQNVVHNAVAASNDVTTEQTLRSDVLTNDEISTANAIEQARLQQISSAAASSQTATAASAAAAAAADSTTSSSSVNVSSTLLLEEEQTIAHDQVIAHSRQQELSTSLRDEMILTILQYILFVILFITLLTAIAYAYGGVRKQVVDVKRKQAERIKRDLSNNGDHRKHRHRLRSHALSRCEQFILFPLVIGVTSITSCTIVMFFLASKVLSLVIPWFVWAGSCFTILAWVVEAFRLFCLWPIYIILFLGTHTEVNVIYESLHLAEIFHRTEQAMWSDMHENSPLVLIERQESEKKQNEFRNANPNMARKLNGSPNSNSNKTKILPVVCIPVVEEGDVYDNNSNGNNDSFFHKQWSKQRMEEHGAGSFTTTTTTTTTVRKTTTIVAPITPVLPEIPVVVSKNLFRNGVKLDDKTDWNQKADES